MIPAAFYTTRAPLNKTPVTNNRPPQFMSATTFKIGKTLHFNSIILLRYKVKLTTLRDVLTFKRKTILQSAKFADDLHMPCPIYLTILIASSNQVYYKTIQPNLI